jgi:hypothetical protein
MAKRDDSPTKVCKVCNVEKPTEGSFWEKSEKRKDGSTGYRSVCSECSIKERLDKYHNKGGKEEQKQRSFRSLMRSYGITPEIYQQERINQNYKCLLCGSPEQDQPHGRLYVDHCHTTGKYRGLLCNLCNTALGQFKDNTEVLQKAIEYLNENRIRHREQPAEKQGLGNSHT